MQLSFPSSWPGFSSSQAGPGSLSSLVTMTALRGNVELGSGKAANVAGVDGSDEVLGIPPPTVFAPCGDCFSCTSVGATLGVGVIVHSNGGQRQTRWGSTFTSCTVSMSVGVFFSTSFSTSIIFSGSPGSGGSCGAGDVGALEGVSRGCWTAARCGGVGFSPPLFCLNI